MTTQENDKPSISNVLKALNSIPRRNILRLLNFYNKPLSFTKIMKELVKDENVVKMGSSQLAYHLGFLVDSQLLNKTEAGYYKISKIGKRTGLILDMAQEDERSAIFSSLYLSFSNLTPRDTLLAAITTPLLVLVSYFVSTLDLLSIPLSLIFISLCGYLYLRLRSILALLFLSTLLWVVFVPGSIYIFSVILFLFLSIVMAIDPLPFLAYLPIQIALTGLFLSLAIVTGYLYYREFSYT